MVDRLSGVVRWLLILPVVLVAFIVLFLGLTVVLVLVDFPRRIGRGLRFEERMRWAVFQIVDAEDMRTFRDDYLHIMESEMPAENMDRWGLLREIDAAQNQVERRLKGGEFAISVMGGVAALAAGEVLGIWYASGLVTLVVIGFSVLVAFRIIVTDTLCYSSAKHRDEPVHRLVLLRAWNQGAVRGKGAFAVALLSILASPGDPGYEIGQGLVDMYLERQLGGFDKWRAE